MKLVKCETRMAQTTFEPIHTLSIEITSTQLEDFSFLMSKQVPPPFAELNSIDMKKEIEQLLGIRFLEILEEFNAQRIVK